MGGPYLLGIDLGTTTCRCAVFDLQGHEVAAAAVEVRVSHPQPLWAEVDPEVWWQSTARVVRQALRRGREAGVEPRLIGGIGLSGLMHAPVLLDATGTPLVPAMLWLDQRCAGQCESLTRQAAIQGIRLARDFGTSQTAPKLRWLAEERPDVLARAAQFLLPKDFLRYRLTGAGGTDESDAGGTGLFDRGARAWARQLVRLTGLPEPALPHIRPATTLAGHVTPQAAAETGLQAGTPVAVGGGDTLCTRLGVGPLGQGEVCIYLGTAAWIAVVAAPEGAEGAGRPAVRTARGFGATATTGAALRWVRDLLGPAAPPGGREDEGGVGATYDALTAAASDV
ncbi:MAG TPA: FGGY family carbohydrate kinase, partial [Chloroflexota bacterium]|nr:FGGY family carbohydrate kinase [Chloroflexota bacterium]